jgi:hypothetical protein
MLKSFVNLGVKMGEEKYSPRNKSKNLDVIQPRQVHSASIFVNRKCLSPREECLFKIY